MIKKTITYTDYNGEERTEDFYFHLNKVELHEMQYSEEGGLVNYLERISSTKDARKIVAMFKEIILKAYGEISPDGKRFIKSPELTLAFEQCPAFEKLYFELYSDANLAVEFCNGILPSDLRTPAKPEAK